MGIAVNSCCSDKCNVPALKNTGYIIVYIHITVVVKNIMIYDCYGYYYCYYRYCCHCYSGLHVALHLARPLFEGLRLEPVVRGFPSALAIRPGSREFKETRKVKGLTAKLSARSYEALPPIRV